MPDPTFHQLRQWGRGRQAPIAPGLSEIDPDAITLLDGPAPPRRPDAPAIGDIDTAALAVVDPFVRSRQGMRDLIASNEASRRGYDSYYRDDKGGHPARPGKPVSQMTLGEIYAYQDQLLRSSLKNSPVGRYQFNKATLKDMQKQLGVSDDAVFDQAMQDRLADALLDAAGFQKYASGDMSAAQFHDNIAGRWASVEYRDTGKTRREPKSPGGKHYPPKTMRGQVLGAISQIDRDREEYRSQE